MSKPAILVDLDGTLVDTFPDLYGAAHRTLQRHGVLAEGLEMDDLRQTTGRGARAILEEMTSRPVRDEWLTQMLDDYEANVAKESRPFPGVEGWFDWPFAVLTNKPVRFARPLVDALFTGRTWPLVTPDDAGESKPAPAGVRLAMDKLAVGPSESIVVGDDLRDYQAAEAAGARFVAVLYGYGFTERESVPAGVPTIETAGELPAVLGKIADDMST